METRSLTILIPAFNEEEAIGATLRELVETPELESAEILVVDDGSADRTAEIAEEFERVRVLRRPENMGYGAAIKAGVRAACGEYVCWYDADGQHRPEDLANLVKAVRDSDSDWGVGVRNAESRQAFARKPGKMVLRAAVRIAARRSVPDFNSGLRMFRRSLLRLYLHLLPNGFSASTTTTLLMLERGYSRAEVEIQTRPRVGRSQVSQVRDGFGTLTLILRIFLLFRPLAFFLSLGTPMIGAGVVYSLWVMSRVHLGVPIAGMLAIVTGLLTVFMGLIADQLSLIRRERFEDLDRPDGARRRSTDED